MDLSNAAEVATICSAVIAFTTLMYQLFGPRRASRRGRSARLNRNEVLLILCILLFLTLGLVIPQAILPAFAVVMVVVYLNMPRSKDRARYTMSALVVTLAGLIGAYLSAFDIAAQAGLPIFYSRDFRVLDIWYLLN